MMDKFTRKLILGLLILALLSPIGIILPKWFKAGNAWGEWSAEDVEKEIGYVPKGMAKDNSLWKAPFQSYQINNDNNSLVVQSGYYVVSGMIGIGIIGLLTLGGIKLFSKK